MLPLRNSLPPLFCGMGRWEIEPQHFCMRPKGTLPRGTVGGRGDQKQDRFLLKPIRFQGGKHGDEDKDNKSAYK